MTPGLFGFAGIPTPILAETCAPSTIEVREANTHGVIRPCFNSPARSGSSTCNTVAPGGKMLVTLTRFRFPTPAFSSALSSAFNSVSLSPTPLDNATTLGTIHIYPNPQLIMLGLCATTPHQVLAPVKRIVGFRGTQGRNAPLRSPAGAARSGYHRRLRCIFQSRQLIAKHDCEKTRGESQPTAFAPVLFLHRPICSNAIVMRITEPARLPLADR